VWELSVDYSGDWYSNRQVLRGIVDVQAFQDIKIGDGNATSFALSFPLASAPTVTLNGNPQKVGVKGIDSGKNWYWQVGDPTIYQDSGGVVLISTDVLVVSGLGTYTTTVTRDNLAGQAERAAVEGGTTGIVTNVTDTKSLGLTLNIAGAQAYGDSLNARYGVIGRTVTFTTIKTGLMQGQMLACFVPQRQMVNTQMLITSVEVTQRTYRTAGNTASTRWVYLVSATELPNSRSWSRQLTSALFGSTGKGKHS